MSRIIGILVGISLASAATFGSDSSPQTERAPAGSSILAQCPNLKRGQEDPIDGKNCVRELQTSLGNLGYEQQVTGRFLGQTEANVKDFQRSHNIEVVGFVGPKTRKALLEAGASSTPRILNVPQSNFSTDVCTSQQCNVYLSRSATRRYADWIARHPVTTSAVTTAILSTACKVVKSSIASIACEIFGDVHVERVKTALTSAAQQNACLRTTLKLPNTLQSPLTFSADNTSRCKS